MGAAFIPNSTWDLLRQVVDWALRYGLSVPSFIHVDVKILMNVLFGRDMKDLAE